MEENDNSKDTFLNLKHNDSKDSIVNLEHNDSNDQIETDEIETDKKGKETNYGREIVEMILYFTVVVCSVLFIHYFVGQQIEVSGSSMESTLHNEDHLILEKLTYQFNEPSRFDIIVFQPYAIKKDTFYIKRVIGLPLETIQIIGNDIFINGEILTEDYGRDEIVDGGIANEEILLGEDEYFLLGDNRNNSKDSRDSSIGVVKRSAILGRAWVRIWPLGKFGKLEHQ